MAEKGVAELKKQLELHDQKLAVASNELTRVTKQFGIADAESPAQKPFLEAKRDYEGLRYFRELLIRKMDSETKDYLIADHPEPSILEQAIPDTKPIGHNGLLGAICLSVGLILVGWGVFLLRSVRVETLDERSGA